MSLSEQCVNLSNELQGHIILIENQGISVLNNDGNLSSLEKHLELLPVVLLFLIIFSVFERVHLDVSWEIPAENLSYKETIIE